MTDSRQEKVVEKLVELTSDRSTTGRNIVCGVELPWLNFNSLSFYAEKYRLRTHQRAFYNSIGYAETDEKTAERRVTDLHPVYFISVDQSIYKLPSDVFNCISMKVLKQLHESGEWTLIPFEMDDGIVVLRNGRHTVQLYRELRNSASPYARRITGGGGNADRVQRSSSGDMT